MRKPPRPTYAHNGQGRFLAWLYYPGGSCNLHGQSMPAPEHESHHQGSAAALRLRPRVISFLQGETGQEAGVLGMAASMIALSATLWSKRFALAKGKCTVPSQGTHFSPRQLCQEISAGWAHSVVGAAVCASHYNQIGQIKLTKIKNNKISLAHLTYIFSFPRKLCLLTDGFYV